MTFTLDLSPVLRANVLARMLARSDARMTSPPDEIIGDAYLRRWHAARTPCYARYHHLYVGDDPEPYLHDHPWPSLSLCLRGVLRETSRIPGGDTRSTAISPGILSYRPPRFAHRLDLVSGPAVTLFLAGPRIREWGWYLPSGWRPWHELSGVDPDGVTRTKIPT